MLVRILTAIFLLGLGGGADAAFECTEIIGKWKGERFEEALNAERTRLVSFFPDGTYRMNWHTFSETLDDHYVDGGYWICANDEMTLSSSRRNGAPAGFIHKYEILQLDQQYFVFKVIEADCSDHWGDCEGVVFGLVRQADDP